MPTRLDINTQVAAPIEDLFDLMDPETEVDWNPDALEVRRIDVSRSGTCGVWIAVISSSSDIGVRVAVRAT